MKEQRRPYIFLILLLVCSCCLQAQTIRVKASIDRNKILIGEPINLQLEAAVEGGAPFLWFAADSIPHFEFIDKGNIDTTTSGATTVYKQQLTITSFDSGRWAIPALAITSGNKNYITDSLPVSVAFTNFDATKDYHDIKDIIEGEAASLQYINWILGAALLIALIIFVYLLRRKRKQAAPVAVTKHSNLSPLQEALQLLQQLSPVTEAKPFHVQLNNILRNYVYRKTTKATAEKTSSELLMQLQAYPIPQDDFIALAQTLRLNDAVKFARFVPDAAENEKALQQITHTIQQLDKLIQ